MKNVNTNEPKKCFNVITHGADNWLNEIKGRFGIDNTILRESVPERFVVLLKNPIKVSDSNVFVAAYCRTSKVGYVVDRRLPENLSRRNGVVKNIESRDLIFATVENVA